MPEKFHELLFFILLIISPIYLFVLLFKKKLNLNWNVISDIGIFYYNGWMFLIFNWIFFSFINFVEKSKFGFGNIFVKTMTYDLSKLTANGYIFIFFIVMHILVRIILSKKHLSIEIQNKIYRIYFEIASYCYFCIAIILATGLLFWFGEMSVPKDIF